MARRPENPRNRGRRSDTSLDWLGQLGQPEQQSGPAPADDDWQVLGSAPAPLADPYPHPDPGAGTDSRPRADPGAPVLSRRALRAQREAAQQAKAEQSQAQQPQADQTQVGQSWTGPVPADKPRTRQKRVNQIQARPAPADQTQAGQAWTHQFPAVQPDTGPTKAPTDQTQAGQAWTHQFPAAGAPLDRQAGGQPDTGRIKAQAPADQTQVGLTWTGQPPEQVATDRATPRRRGGARPGTPPASHNASGYPFAIGGQTGLVEDDRPEPEPEAEPKARPRRRGVAIWLTLAALVPAAWSATSFIDSDNIAIAGLAAIAPLVSLLALPIIAVGVASKHLVPTAIAVVAALMPWTLVTGYAAAGPGQHEVGSNRTLRVMSVDGAKGRASAQDIVQVTRLYAVDVIVVTDLTSEQAHDLTVAGLGALAPARWVDVTSGGGQGTGLWARPEIAAPTPITGLGRAGVDGVITAGTRKIGITVVHLAGDPLRPGKGWRSDLAALGTRTPPAKDSFIVGDLNASPWQPAFRRLTKSKWRDAADAIGQGLRPTWPSWSPLPISPVDHVLASPGLGVAGADTTSIGGSTNRALIVTLILPDGSGEGD